MHGRVLGIVGLEWGVVLTSQAYGRKRKLLKATLLEA
jgi:hypothetical protein